MLIGCETLAVPVASLGGVGGRDPNIVTGAARPGRLRPAAVNLTRPARAAPDAGRASRAMSAARRGCLRAADAVQVGSERGCIKVRLAPVCGCPFLPHGTRPRRPRAFLGACRDCPVGELAIITIQEGRRLDDESPEGPRRDHGQARLPCACDDCQRALAGRRCGVGERPAATFNVARCRNVGETY